MTLIRLIIKTIRNRKKTRIHTQRTIADRPPLSMDICLRSAQQQTRSTQRTPGLRSIDGTDRRRDGRTTDRYVDPSRLAQSARHDSTELMYGLTRLGRLYDDFSYHLTWLPVNLGTTRPQSGSEWRTWFIGIRHRAVPQ